MPQPYSPDLRRRVLRAGAAHAAPRAKLARCFQISETTLYRWLQQARTDGRTAAKPHAGGRVARFDATLVRTLP